MRQGIQNNFKHEELRRFGCFFFTLLRMVELIAGKNFDNDETIITMFHECKRKGFIGSNSFIRDSVAVLNHCAGSRIARNISRQTNLPAADHIIVHMQKPRVEHFAVCDRRGAIVWDSWAPSAAGQNYPVLNYRVVS